MKRRRTNSGVLVAVVTAIVVSASIATGAGATASRADAHGHAPGSYAGLTARQTRRLAAPLARARAATAKYATDLERAKADGYRMTITQMIPDMGYHFLNPDITEFDVTRPPILVYVKNGDDWQLAGFEWVFPEKPETRPLPGAQYGSFPAACHYEDGLFVFEGSESECPQVNPESGATFTFWHPRLVTLHVWAWYPNPAGLYAGMNQWVRPFNDGQI